MKSLAVALIVIALFAASPLVLDESVCGYDQALPMHGWKAHANDGDDISDRAIDFAPGTWWVGARAESTRWTVTFPAPTWLSGVQIDVGNYHGWTVPARGIGISLDGGPLLLGQVAIDVFFNQWERFRFEPRKVRTLSIQILPWQVGSEGKWCLFDVRFIGIFGHDMSRRAFVESLPRLALPLAAALAWLLYLRPGTRRR